MKTLFRLLIIIMVGATALGFIGSFYADNSNGFCTSQYVMPEKDLFYRYGNFCGPRYPVGESDPANLTQVLENKPVDSIDLRCKLHDLCFNRFGADNMFCDDLLYQGLSSTEDLEFYRYGQLEISDDLFTTAGSTLTNDQYFIDRQCENVAREINLAFSLKMKSQDEMGSLAKKVGSTIASPFIGGRVCIQCILAARWGFPKEGMCFTKRNRAAEERVAETLAKARAVHECESKQIGIWSGDVTNAECFDDKVAEYNDLRIVRSFLDTGEW